MSASLRPSSRQHYDHQGLAMQDEDFPEKEVSEAMRKRLQEIMDRIRAGETTFRSFDPAELLEDD